MKRAAVLALLLSAPSAADQVHGFVSQTPGELAGRVTDGHGKPVAKAQVHVVSSTGAEQVVTTDRDGRFHVASRESGAKTIVYVSGDVKLGAGTVTTREITDGEVVELAEVVPPAVNPKPIGDPLIVPEYSDAAWDKDAWTRAWLLLDIDETGVVTRLKLIGKPGYDLDAIAIREGFKLRFEPARDRANRPIRAKTLWTFEWPAYSWLSKTRSRRSLPREVRFMPCRRDHTKVSERDCSQPNLGAVLTEPWTEPAKRH